MDFDTTIVSAATSASMAPAMRHITKHTVNQLHELRIHIATASDPTDEQSQPVTVKLLSGSCESFGTNMISTLQYQLRSPGGYSFFTWSGCEIEVVGAPSLVYTTNDTLFPLLANINNELEKDRKHSTNTNIAGPVVLMIGRQETGKTSMLRTLCHYALRTGWSPTYVDLNPECNNLSIPGTITATPVELQSKPNHLLSFAKTTPLVYYFGHSQIKENRDLFLTQCKALAAQIDTRVTGSEMRGTDIPGYNLKTPLQPIPSHLIQTTKHAGVFIDTPGELCDDVMTEAGAKLIEDICRAFGVNVIFVVDNEPLHAKLIQTPIFTTLNNGVAISRVPKLLGAINMGTEKRLWWQSSSVIDQYFYGLKNKMKPFSQAIDMSKFSIYSTSPMMLVPLTALPLGAQEDYKATIGNSLDQLNYADIKPNSIIALSYAQDPDSLATTPVAGFLHVVSVPNQHDPVKSISSQILYCTLPSRMLPHHLKYFLMGTLGWNNTRF